MPRRGTKTTITLLHDTKYFSPGTKVLILRLDPRRDRPPRPLGRDVGGRFVVPPSAAPGASVFDPRPELSKGCRPAVGDGISWMILTMADTLTQVNRTFCDVFDDDELVV